MSAGRIYDKIGKKAKAKVVLVTDYGTICNISKKSFWIIKRRLRNLKNKEILGRKNYVWI